MVPNLSLVGDIFERAGDAASTATGSPAQSLPAANLPEGFADWFGTVHRMNWSEATDVLQAGVCRLPRQVALQKKNIQANPAALVRLLCLDLDHENSVDRLAAMPLQPNVIIANPANGHAHAFWVLKDAVSSDKARKYARAVRKGLCAHVGGDEAYSGHLMKNPLHAAWETLWLHDHEFELKELADSVRASMPSQFAKKARWAGAGSVGDGRNATLFTALGHEGPRIALRYRKDGDVDGLRAAIAERAWELHAELCPTLPSHEVRAIAYSVSAYTMQSNLCNGIDSGVDPDAVDMWGETLRDKQAWRGRRSHQAGSIEQAHASRINGRRNTGLFDKIADDQELLHRFEQADKSRSTLTEFIDHVMRTFTVARSTVKNILRRLRQLLGTTTTATTATAPAQIPPNTPHLPVLVQHQYPIGTSVQATGAEAEERLRSRARDFIGFMTAVALTKRRRKPKAQDEVQYVSAEAEARAEARSRDDLERSAEQGLEPEWVMDMLNAGHSAKAIREAQAARYAEYEERRREKALKFRFSSTEAGFAVVDPQRAYTRTEALTVLRCFGIEIKMKELNQVLEAAGWTQVRGVAHRNSFEYVINRVETYVGWNGVRKEKIGSLQITGTGIRALVQAALAEDSSQAA